MASPTVPALDSKAEPQPATLGWALRRAALGLFILLVTAGAVAWLLDASIEPDGTARGPASKSEYALPN